MNRPTFAASQAKDSRAKCKTGDEDASAALAVLLNDPALSVRRAAALAVGRLKAGNADEILVNALLADDGKDLFLHDGLVHAIERLGKRGIERLLQAADSGVEGDRNKVVEAFRGLHIHPAAEVLPRLLSNPHHSIAQRSVGAFVCQLLVRSAGFA